MHYFDEKIRTIVQNVAKEGSEIFLEFPLMLSNSLTSIFFRTSAICILHIVGHSKLNYKMIYVSYPWKIVEFHSFSLISNFLFDNGQSKHKKGLSYTRLSSCQEIHNFWREEAAALLGRFFLGYTISLRIIVVKRLPRREQSQVIKKIESRIWFLDLICLLFVFIEIWPTELPEKVE